MFSRKTTTSTVVFVDDFVQGGLPEVSVMSGAPTSSRLTLSTPIDGPSPAWLLLIFLGPIGWIAIALIYGFARRSSLVGRVPITKHEYLEYRSAKRRGLGVAIAGFTALLASLATAIAVELPRTALGLLVLASLAAMLCGAIIYGIAQARLPKVSLDGSRRWTTLHGVHPAFAAAVDHHDVSASRVRRS